MSHAVVIKNAEHLDIYSKVFDELIEAIRENYDTRNLEGGRQLPWKGVRLLKDFRFGAITLPKELGGAGASFVDLFRAVIQLAWADPELAHIFQAHFKTVEFLLQDESAASFRILKEVRQGAMIGNAHQEDVEHQVGGGMYDSKLVKEGDHFRLHGKKALTAGTYYADYVEVTAKLDEKLVKVIIPVEREGVTPRDDWDGFGQKRSGIGTTIFDHVHVDKDEIFTLNDEQSSYFLLSHLYIQGILAGIVKRIVTDAVELIKKGKHSVGGKASEAKQDPQLQQVIGELSSYAFAAESLVLQAAEKMDDARFGQGDTKTEHQAALGSLQAKVVIEKLALKAANVLFHIGDASLTKQSEHLDRHWRNIRTLASLHSTLDQTRTIGNVHLNQQKLPSKHDY